MEGAKRSTPGRLRMDGRGSKEKGTPDHPDDGKTKSGVVID
jgi:hypothetical protein